MADINLLNGRYKFIVKNGNKTLPVKKIDIHSITFDREHYSIGEVKKWCRKYKFDIKGIHEFDHSFTNIINDTDSYCIDVLMKTGIKATVPMEVVMKKGLKKDIKLHIPFEFKASKKDSRIIEGMASTAAIDREDDIVKPEAFKSSLEQFMKNPVLTFMHDWAFPIGKILDATIIDKEGEQGGLRIVAQISKTVERIWSLIEEGILKAFSIGFKIKKVELSEDTDSEIRTITDLELYEVAVVTIPANAPSLFNISKALDCGSDIECKSSSIIVNPMPIEMKEFSRKILSESKDATDFITKLNTLEVVKQLDNPDKIIDGIKLDKKEIEDKATYNCECVECGNKVESKKHCKDIKCSKCGGEMRRAERPGPGRSAEARDFGDKVTKLDGRTESFKSELIKEHFHSFDILQDENGNIRGVTTEELEHVHIINNLIDTIEANGHKHKLKFKVDDVDEEASARNNTEEEKKPIVSVSENLIISKELIERLRKLSEQKEINLKELEAVLEELKLEIDINEIKTEDIEMLIKSLTKLDA